MTRWLPWLIAGALLVAMAGALRSCSAERTARKATAANLAALKLAYEHQSVEIDAMRTAAEAIECEGEWIMRKLPDGTSERVCRGKVRIKIETREVEKRVSIPVLPPMPGVVAKDESRPWLIGGGPGLTLDGRWQGMAVGGINLSRNLSLAVAGTAPAVLAGYGLLLIRF